MSQLFRARIRAALANQNLQSALDANAERRIQVRQVAFASLVNPQELRLKAHRLRADVIEHLDRYLEQFTAQATKNGMQVHRAFDAAEAVNIVLGITNQKGARLVAKSKTMVSEEIGFNHALENKRFKDVGKNLGE